MDVTRFTNSLPLRAPAGRGGMLSVAADAKEERHKIRHTIAPIGWRCFFIFRYPPMILRFRYNYIYPKSIIEVSEKRNFEKMFFTEIRFFRSLTFLSSFDGRRGIARSV
jgi:hypothetical protein